MSNGKYNAARRRQQQQQQQQQHYQQQHSGSPSGVPSPLRTSRPSQGGSGLDEITDSDDFRMYCMKVLPCSKRVAHDWTTCPFAHNGEKARRRDPRKYSYTGIACVDMKDGGSCERGDDCPYAHSTFEYWLHPTRYRTQLCKDLGNCRRETCFFAHHPNELRIPDQKPHVSPEQLAMSSLSGIRRSMERERGQQAGHPAGTPRGRHQPEDLAFTPHSSAQSEAHSPRAPGYDPVAVRSSAPMLGSFTTGSNMSPSGGWAQQPVRSSANAMPIYNFPVDIQRQRADEIALANALSKLSVSLSQNQERNPRRDDVIQTVHQVLQHALDQKESSLGYDISQSLEHMGGMTGAGYSDGSSADLSARGDGTSACSSADIASPHIQHSVDSIDGIHSGELSPTSVQRQTRVIDPWGLGLCQPAKQ